MFKSLKKLLGLSLLAFFGVWMGCSSESSPVSPSNKAVTDDDGSATQVSTFTVSTEVSIPDDSLRVAVTQELWHLSAAGKLDIPTGSNPLTTANLAEIKVLKARGKGIVNLTGLEAATNLDTLDLEGNSITKVDSLAGLTGLEYLNLKRNDVANLEPLAGLRNLNTLNLENNLIPAAGYPHLANLTKLRWLTIGGHRNVDIGNPGIETLVAGMPDLEGLKLNHMGLTDIAFLEDLPKLSYINIRSNQITNFKPLVCLKNLVRMHVGNNPGTGSSAEGYDPFIQYLIDKGVTTYF